MMLNNNKRKIFLGLSILLIGLMLLGSILPVVAYDSKIAFQQNPPDDSHRMPMTPPMYHNGIAKIETDKLTVAVTADGKVLHFMYWNTSDPSIVYHAKFVQIMEYIDRNGDGAFQYNEVVSGSMFSISAVDFAFSGFENITDSNGDVIGIKFSFNSTNVDDIRQSNLELDVICFLFYKDTKVDGIDVNGLTEMKFTIVIKNWKWVRNDSNLAVRFDLTWSNSSDKPMARVGDNHFDFQHGEGVEHRISNTAREKRRIEMTYKGVTGYLDYIPDVNVDEKNAVTNATYSVYNDHMRVFFAYPHFNNTLVHDPIIGVTTETEASSVSIEGTLGQLMTSDYLTYGVLAIVVIIVAIVIKKIRR